MRFEDDTAAEGKREDTSSLDIAAAPRKLLGLQALQPGMCWPGSTRLGPSEGGIARTAAVARRLTIHFEMLAQTFGFCSIQTADLMTYRM